jgi:hypothetical protein
MPRTTRKTTITPKGIDEARKADMPTEDFSRDRTINIINVKQMADPQIHSAPITHLLLTNIKK